MIGRTTAAPGRPLPLPDPDSQPFWAGCLQQQLLAPRCASCQRHHWPPLPRCPGCRGRDIAWSELDGTGSVAAYVVVHRAFHEAFAAEVPYVLAHAVMDGTDGLVVLVTFLRDADPTGVRVGMAVRTVFEELDAGTSIPCFVPAADPEGTEEG